MFISLFVYKSVERIYILYFTSQLLLQKVLLKFIRCYLRHVTQFRQVVFEKLFILTCYQLFLCKDTFYIVNKFLLNLLPVCCRSINISDLLSGLTQEIMLQCIFIHAKTSKTSMRKKKDLAIHSCS